MLKREISATNVLIAAAGGMVGSGWLFSPFISAQIAGSHALISWVIAAFFMVLVALPLCELGAMFPISGGMTNYPSFTHGRDVGFLFAWVSWLSYVVMTPIEIQAILQYSSHFFPSLVKESSSAGLVLSGIGYAVAVVIMLLVVLLNSFGIKLLAQCNQYASIIKFIMPSLAMVALFSTAPSWFSNLHESPMQTSDWVDVFSALSMGGIVFAFTGFQNGLMLAGEVMNPQRNIPFAILGAIFIGFLLYFTLQWSFLVAIPPHYLHSGWHHFAFPGDNGPLVGLLLLVGLGWVAFLLMLDAMFSPFGTTLVYTAATSRILYGMSLNHHVPEVLARLNRYKIPYLTLYVNGFVGVLSFLPFPGWQKMVAFLSSCSVLSYGIGPMCFLAIRRLQPNRFRPFKLSYGVFVSHLAFYVANLMLYWCGFDILWKLDVALLAGLLIHWASEKSIRFGNSLYWFFGYMLALLLLSYLGTFGGIGIVVFPLDMALMLPLSIVALLTSLRAMVTPVQHQSLLSSVMAAEQMAE